DAFSRSGWLWPVDAKGEPLKATSYMAVGFYVAKYVNKKSDMDLAAKGLSSRISLRGRSAASLRQNCVTVFSFSKNHFSSPSGRWSIVLLISSWGSTL